MYLCQPRRPSYAPATNHIISTRFWNKKEALICIQGIIFNMKAQQSAAHGFDKIALAACTAGYKVSERWRSSAMKIRKVLYFPSFERRNKKTQYIRVLLCTLWCPEILSSELSQISQCNHMLYPHFSEYTQYLYEKSYLSTLQKRVL